LNRELSYADVTLIPKKTIVASRDECDTTVGLAPGCHFEMPIYPANMPSVVNEQTCKHFAQHGWFYTMHRFGTDNVKFSKMMQCAGLFSSISVGLIGEEDIEKLQEVEPEFITIDIANAYSIAVEKVITDIKRLLPKSILIVGNVATKAAVWELECMGADAIKVGIAGGHACTTRLKTGFYRPMITAIQDCAETARVPIIADGGINTAGDVAKAIAAGASLTMAGMLFSGYDESAGNIEEMPKMAGFKQFKRYYGSASEFNKTDHRHIEGTSICVSYKGSINNLMRELKEDLQSAISYAGGRDLSALRNVEMVEVSR
jgi:GMP reductase